MRLKVIFLFLLGILALVFVVILFLSSPSQKKPQIEAPKTLSFDKDYSSVNKIAPGKSTTQDAIKTNGQPNLMENRNGKTYYYYNTPSLDFKNMIVFKNNVEEYALENIFGSYRGDYGSFTKAYGQPDFPAYDKDFPYVWQIFLSIGIGVETNNKNIIKIIYFIPSNKDYFTNGIGEELNLSTQKPNLEDLPL